MLEKRQILLVEDNMDLVEVIRKGLEFLGYEIKVAENGVKAMEIAISEHPDLIVMDIRMPDMDGLQASSKIRQNSKTKDIPILAATASTGPEDREKCLASGCNGYISKPFTYRELGAAIEKLLEKRVADPSSQGQR